MKEICEYLYESHLCELETDLRIQEVRNKIDTALDDLSELLPSSEHKRLLEIDELQDDLEDLLRRDAFESGYHLGLRLVSEVLAQEDHSERFKIEWSSNHPTVPPAL